MNINKSLLYLTSLILTMILYLFYCNKDIEYSYIASGLYFFSSSLFIFLLTLFGWFSLHWLQTISIILVRIYILLTPILIVRFETDLKPILTEFFSADFFIFLWFCIATLWLSLILINIRKNYFLLYLLIWILLILSLFISFMPSLFSSFRFNLSFFTGLTKFLGFVIAIGSMMDYFDKKILERKDKWSQRWKKLCDFVNFKNINLE